ncbi:uncharacterized protein [Mytilus edulis]|uniref:uncharacterized protein n=1 Tax=Mytilus edulis TaxID=6550 RepID=UPI0039EF912C
MDREGYIQKRVVVIAMDGSKEADSALQWFAKNIHLKEDQVKVVYCLHHSSHYTMDPSHGGSGWNPFSLLSGRQMIQTLCQRNLKTKVKMLQRFAVTLKSCCKSLRLMAKF